jgi:type I restriction enzyme R subunit
MLAVVEAKAAYKLPGDGLQQAKDYAAILGLEFAYSTNGRGIVEFDFTTGKERQLDTFPKPAELWERFRASEKIDDEEIASRILTPANAAIGKGQRYYQEIAINRVVQAVLQGKKRILLTMATGTGKTAVAFQICWKLWNMRWNRAGEHRRPKILYLADRNILIDDPKDKMFTTFGDARWKIENGEVNKGRELYLAIYQAIAKDDNRPGLYKEYAKDFFDLIIVDECHRGSAKAISPLTGHCARGASGPIESRKTRRVSSRNTDRKRARSSVICWKNTPSTAPRNSSSPTCSKSRRFQSEAT